MAEKLTDITKVKDLLAVYVKNNYEIDQRPYALNILGVRSPNNVANKFDDAIYILWKDDKNEWNGKKYNATTDPGTYYLKDKLLSNLGTAILKAGQYKNSHSIGFHRGKYKALVQTGNVTVYRDYNRDNILNWTSPRQQTGSTFGINIHRAKASGTTNDVADWSAGCQVFANADDFQDFLTYAEKHKNLYENKFTYTLIDEREIQRNEKKNNVFLIGGSIIVLGYLFYTIYSPAKFTPFAAK